MQHLRRAQHRRSDVRIAVAIAADPAADGEERRQPRQSLQREALLQGVLELRVEARQLVQEGEAEIVDAVGYLVGDLQPGKPQHRREPEAQYLGVDRFVTFAALPLCDQPRDLTLAFEDALALHLGRMRGEHRAHPRPAEPCHELFQADAAHFVERVGQASRPARRAGLRVRAAPAVLLLVLGDVQEMREEAERAHHVHRLVEVERVQETIELRLAGVLLAERHRGLPDALDALERIGARLVADHLAQQPAQEAPVFAERILLIVERSVHRPLQESGSDPG